MKELKDSVALVTGASRGIGEATARMLAGEGAKVVLFSRSGDRLDAIVRSIRDSGGEADALAGDVTRFADIQRAVDTCRDRFGGLDVLVNNAGLIDPISRIADSDPDAWVEAADANYKGVYFGLRAALPVMQDQRSGVIVNVSSGAATSPLEGWSHYCSSKAAALMLTRCAHLEYAETGIRVVGLSPGTVATDMQVSIRESGINPVSQLEPSAHIPPEDAAKAILWLCTPAASDYAGRDFSLKTPEGRRMAGLDDRAG